MLTIKAKIVLAYTLVFGVLISAFATIIYESVLDAELTKLDARLESHADKIQTELEEDRHEPGFPRRSELDSVRTEGLPTAMVRLLTLDKDVVFADSGFQLETRLKWNSGSETTPQKGTVKINHHRYRVQQWPVEFDDGIQYLVQVAAPMRDIEDNLEHLTLLFLISIPAGLLLAGCAAYFITVMAFKPMMLMVRTAETISAARLDARLELPKARDEVHLLGNALNDMIERIDSAMRSQKQFIADASHELRTPLTILRTELESVHRASRTTSLKRGLSSAIDELDHLSSMVNNLLTLARLDAAQMKLDAAPVRLDELLIECVQDISGVAKKKGVRLKVYVQEAIEIVGDREKLKSVIFNLLDNAIKYSGAKNSVSASLTLGQGAFRSAVISIVDRGLGIAKTDQARIFTRFYRAPQSRSNSDGSGLGLAIAQRFVELHGGTISARSEEGKGSTFTVELPLKYAPS